jgi:hypothetical protein
VSTLSLRLPESLHRAVGKLAREEGISINQLVSTAVAEKLSALRTVEILGERAARGDRKAFERVLARVPAGPPILGDHPVEASPRKPRIRLASAKKGSRNG